MFFLKVCMERNVYKMLKNVKYNEFMFRYIFINVFVYVIFYVFINI